MANVNWDRVAKGVAREHEKMIWRPYGIPTVLDLENSAFHDAGISDRWDIPEKLVVSVAITGAFFRHDQNPNQPLTPGAILDSAREVARAGASTVHIHVRDDEGYNVLSPDRFRQVIKPLRDEFPELAVDGCLVPALAGEWDLMKEVLQAGVLDAAPINTTATYIGDSLFVKPAPIMIEKVRLINEAGAKPEIAVYTDADVSNADRFLFRSGLIEKGAAWLVLPALPGCSPMENPRQMIEGLTRTVSAIRDIDPDAFIMVCAAGRASTHVATLAALMGLHIRVGMEDTYFLWPHRDDRIESNLQALRIGQQIAEVTGRPVATPAEYRAMLGLPARHGAASPTA
ncbi:3-keto-5-aminohexanoate cleavage protein [Streptomyces afghaniensis]|uniref:3-keto-5-aminohexanoate cleavage protein n=1 Tax=Streptomyces afghaniensis TaxID=66865 RepID=UPI003799CAF8